MDASGRRSLQTPELTYTYISNFLTYTIILETKTLLAQWLTRQHKRTRQVSPYLQQTPLTPTFPSQSEKASHPLPTQQAVCSNRAATLTPTTGVHLHQKDRHLPQTQRNTFDDPRQSEGRQHKTTSPAAATAMKGRKFSESQERL